MREISEELTASERRQATAARELTQAREDAARTLQRYETPQAELARRLAEIDAATRLLIADTPAAADAINARALDAVNAVVAQAQAELEQAREEAIRQRRQTDPGFDAGMTLAEDAAARMDLVRNSADLVRASFDDAGAAATDFFLGAATGADALQAVLGDLERRLINLALNSFLFGPIEGGLARLFSPAGAAAVQTRHQGGPVDGLGAFRLVDPRLFESAQRYHAGGWPGLAPNEVPTILERGETVLPRGATFGSTVQIIDQRAASAPPIEQERTRGPDGREMVRMIIRQEMDRATAEGSMDRPNLLRFGQKVRLY